MKKHYVYIPDKNNKSETAQDLIQVKLLFPWEGRETV
jgi:hypothetical protein